MSTNKYANLPDIDTAPDIYETDDAVPTYAGIGNSSEDESSVPSRSSATNIRSKNLEITEGVDSSGLIDSNEATRRFRKAERKYSAQHRDRLIFSYPMSSPPSPTSQAYEKPLASRLRSLQVEVEALETELADPASSVLQYNAVDNSEIDAGELIRGLVDVRRRLENVKKSREGRDKLVGMILDQVEELEERREPRKTYGNEESAGQGRQKLALKTDDDKCSIADFDRRVSELEDLIGSSSIALDETTPLPVPLLPMLNRLNTQIVLLTQPRHLDSISRRLKLLISDLDRLSATHNAQSGGRRQIQLQQSTASGASASTPSIIQEQILSLLARLAPQLPHLPHLLVRMRTLADLHASAADAQSILSTLEGEQLRARGRLDILVHAVEGVEKSLEDNAHVVRGNVSGLEKRIENLVKRLDALN